MSRSHGMSKHPAYHAWQSMKTRCTNPNTNRAHLYIERGIKVCRRWLHSFENFWEDMGSSWQPELQLDRIDNEGNYTPKNCRWATRSQQMKNRRSNGRIGSKHSAATKKKMSRSQKAMWVRKKLSR